MNITNTELNIRTLIDYAINEQIWLPEFQRPFVWDKNQVRLLIDSLYRNYTISSILIWKGGDELARRAVGARVKDIKIPNNKTEDVTYLLDGQQRTTALTLAFTSKAIYKGTNNTKKEKIELYWDSKYNGDDAETKWVFDDEKIDNDENPQEPFMLKEFTESELYSKFGDRFINLKHAYKFDDSIVESWFDISIVEEENKMLRFKNSYNKKLKEIENSILARKVYDIEQKGSLEQVLEVFERINTKNTKLSIFDIMVAKTYRKYPEGYFDLRNYYKIIKYDGVVKNGYFENLKNIDLDKTSLPVDDSDMLQLTMIMINYKFKGNEVLQLNTQQLIDNTKVLHDKFNTVVQFMQQNFSIEATELRLYNPLLKFIAGAISHYNNIDVKLYDFLRVWFWNTLLKNRYPGAQSERIEKDFQLLISNSTFEDKLTKIVNETTRNFEYLSSNSYSNPKYFDAYYSNRSQQIYRGMLLLLKSKGAKDFYNGFTPLKSVSNENKLEEHHIFPKNSKIGKEIVKKYENDKYDDIINNISNIALITKKTNNQKIGSKPPSEYITDFENEYKIANKHNEFIQIMETQFISVDMIEMLKKDDFENFIVARTKLIYEKLELLCGNKKQ